MKEFPGDNFLLSNETAVRLYNEHARTQPIFDFHCHLPVKEIAEDKKFASLSEIWLAGDHYKWRAMRTYGIDEQYITGDADDFTKFSKWAETVPATLRHPLYHWTHMELKHPFGITGKLLSPATAEEIYTSCNRLLQTADFSTRRLLERAHVKILCTTDDPADDLAHHKALAADPSFGVKVLPAFRPDKALNIDQPEAFNAWLDKLAAAAGGRIAAYHDLLSVLEERIRLFHAAGCRISDHGIEQPYAADFNEASVRNSFAKARAGQPVSTAEALEYKSAVLCELGRLYHKYDWAMQLHMGVIRNVNTQAFRRLGPDTGYDAVGDFAVAAPLCRYLDRLEQAGALPRTVLYIINPADNEIISNLAGCFQDSTARGKIQFGAAWWFNDHKQGMLRHLEALSANSLLSGFIGMLTDSRSFLSFARHDYFRRLFCDLLARDVEAGELPADFSLLGKTVEDVCYRNAVNYFRIGHDG